jgi:Helix-turn-helix domain
MTSERPGQMRIGQVLIEARERAGIDLREAEDRTKIRVRYLQALEDEHWAALPSHAYAKGFLRSYANLLALDGDALVDEFRRQTEGEQAQAGYPLGDQVLESRRGREGSRRPSAALIAVLVALVAIAAIVVVVIGGDDDQPRERRGADAPRRTKDREQGSERAEGKVTLALKVREPLEVCLLGGGGEELIDGQVLAVGTEEAYERRRFELRFPRGFAPDQFRLELDGDRRLLPRAEGPAAYEVIAPRRIVAAPAPGEECP